MLLLRSSRTRTGAHRLCSGARRVMMPPVVCLLPGHACRPRTLWLLDSQLPQRFSPPQRRSHTPFRTTTTSAASASPPRSRVPCPCTPIPSFSATFRLIPLSLSPQMMFASPPPLCTHDPPPSQASDFNSAMRDAGLLPPTSRERTPPENNPRLRPHPAGQPHPLASTFSRQSPPPPDAFVGARVVYTNGPGSAELVEGTIIKCFFSCSHQDGYFPRTFSAQRDDGSVQHGVQTKWVRSSNIPEKVPVAQPSEASFPPASRPPPAAISSTAALTEASRPSCTALSQDWARCGWVPSLRQGMAREAAARARGRVRQPGGARVPGGCSGRFGSRSHPQGVRRCQRLASRPQPHRSLIRDPRSACSILPIPS